MLSYSVREGMRVISEMVRTAARNAQFDEDKQCRSNMHRSTLLLLPLLVGELLLLLALLTVHVNRFPCLLLESSLHWSNIVLITTLHDKSSCNISGSFASPVHHAIRRSRRGE